MLGDCANISFMYVNPMTKSDERIHFSNYCEAIYIMNHNYLSFTGAEKNCDLHKDIPQSHDF